MAPNISQITETLYLSGRQEATDGAQLRELGITNILTIDSFPLATTDYPGLEGFETLFIRKEDSLDADLLNEFDKCHKFIDDSLGATLVHCFVGMSRSATIVISYLMVKRQAPLATCLEFVKKKRYCVGPNDAFISQLKLFEKMKFSIDEHDERYRQFQLSQLSKRVIQCSGFENLEPGVRERFVCNQISDGGTMKCKYCRTVVSYSRNLITHGRGEHIRWWSSFSEESEGNPAQNAEPQPTNCDVSHFILPSSPLVETTFGLQGKVYCPKCGNRIGRYSWIKLSCECLATMSPAFLLFASKVDLN